MCLCLFCRYSANKQGSRSTRPGTNSAPESTWPRVNSAGSTRPVIFLMVNRDITYVPNKKFGRYDLEYAR